MSSSDNPLFEKYALISKYIIDEKQPITWVFRDEPESDDDSGWRILSGAEDEEFFEDQEDSFVGITVAELLRYDTSLVPIIESAYTTEYERENENSAWEQVTDDLE